MRAKTVLGSVLVMLLMSLAACQTASPPPEGPGDPDLAAADLRRAWLAAPSDRLYAGMPTTRGGKTRSRAFIRRQTQNLVFRHPDHVPARMLAAVMAYESHDRVNATQHLDHLLRLQPSHPEAAVLRARIALEEGNSPYAVRLLEDQVRMRPDHSGLRELHASALYLSGNREGAKAALDAAAALGASPARVAYNRGLVAEEEGNAAAAEKYYKEALSHAPHWPRPKERLAGLSGAPLPPPAVTSARMPFEVPDAPPLPAATLR